MKAASVIQPTRRSVLAMGAALLPAAETYDTHAKGIRILPGQWRPHYPWEQIGWVSPPWPSQDYLWLDFPEAVFTSQGLLFLSHVNPPIPTVFQNLPRAPWREVAGGIAFERTLPNGVRFGGNILRQGERLVGLELRIENGSTLPLERITLQTCAFLRAVKEFADFSNSNKYVHTRESGWTPLSEALKLEEQEAAPFRVGWRRSGKRVADLPVMVTVSNQAERLVAMSWHAATLSLVGNPRHPCMHADPQFPDLAPGRSATVRGHLLFFEGKLADFRWDKQAPAAQ